MAGLEMLIAAWMAAHHYPDHLNAAIRKRIRVESSFNPDARDKAGAACLHQWLGERRRALFKFAGMKEDDAHCPPWQKQLEYMDQELRTSAYSAVWAAKPSDAFLVVSAVYSRPKDLSMALAEPGVSSGSSIPPKEIATHQVFVKSAKQVAWEPVVNLKLDIKAPAPQRVTALIDAKKTVIFANNTYWTNIPKH